MLHEKNSAMTLKTAAVKYQLRPAPGDAHCELMAGKHVLGYACTKCAHVGTLDYRLLGVRNPTQRNMLLQV
jgi:hypothetical protein